MFRPPRCRFFYPDNLVVPNPPEFLDEAGDVVRNPLFVAEVLSDSTEHVDRGEKQTCYLNTPSVLEYWLIAQDRVRIERHHRAGPAADWAVRRVRGPGRVGPAAGAGRGGGGRGGVPTGSAGGLNRSVPLPLSRLADARRRPPRRGRGPAADPGRRRGRSPTLGLPAGAVAGPVIPGLTPRRRAAGAGVPPGERRAAGAVPDFAVPGGRGGVLRFRPRRRGRQICGRSWTWPSRTAPRTPGTSAG